MKTIDVNWKNEVIEVEVDYLTSIGYSGSLEEPAEEPEIEIKTIYINGKEIRDYKTEFYNEIYKTLEEEY